jgi:ribosome-associated protein
MAAASLPPSASLATTDLLRAIVRALDAKKAGDLQILRVAAHSTITDYLVLATGTSEPHLRALRVELEKAIDGLHAPLAGMEVAPGSGWLVVDAYQVMVHLFLAEQRSQYRLEQLWRDAEVVTVDEVLTQVAPRKAARKSSSAATAPAKRKTVAVKKPTTKKAAKKTATRPATKRKSAG